ncbi:MAG TPA: squalene synthase HpnC [Hydrogenophaga sp.]|uniref:squalene synthase HpnC n=1 Tax=Hydrogenophaga sp. TaxID=1904254 RepID=UPI002C19F138|nr:squalene synthase HpnC [Hydrogenophaga sp.]HMN92974.1 squalene synthase HpnC [Hydrogenophaga sp.]HMP09140.1 squalene synthase HpnC [Hydrogenophaga sp.]
MAAAPQPLPETGPAGLAGGVAHYENFPVASWLCPPQLRAPVAAIYHFARTADDLADEGDLPASHRLQALALYRQCLDSINGPDAPNDLPWAPVFGPLRLALHEHALPTALLHDLLSAFEQDVRHTDSGHRYADIGELLDYCRLSANPVGRLLLHLYAVHDPLSLQQSDSICSALQLINFWQDLSVDLPRKRHYLPADLLSLHGLDTADFEAAAARARPDMDRSRSAVVTHLCEHARKLMLEGAPLARRLPGRAGWELRLVVQGGLRVLERIGQVGHRSWEQKVRIGRTDLPLLLWRSWRM